MIADRVVCRECLVNLLQRKVALPTVTGLDGPFDLDSCPGCGVTLESVRARGLLGCPACYAAFNGFVQSVTNESVASARP